MMNNKLVIAILILLTSITTYSFEFESTVEFCEIMIEEAIDNSSLGTEEDVERVKEAIIKECNKVVFFLTKEEKEIVLVDKSVQCKESCDKTKREKAKEVIKDDAEETKVAVEVGAVTGTKTDGVIGAVESAVEDALGAVVETGLTITKKTEKVINDSNKCVEKCK